MSNQLRKCKTMYEVNRKRVKSKVQNLFIIKTERKEKLKVCGCFIYCML